MRSAGENEELEKKKEKKEKKGKKEKKKSIAHCQKFIVAATRGRQRTGVLRRTMLAERLAREEEDK